MFIKIPTYIPGSALKKPSPHVLSHRVTHMGAHSRKIWFLLKKKIINKSRQYCQNLIIPRSLTCLHLVLLLASIPNQREITSDRTRTKACKTMHE